MPPMEWGIMAKLVMPGLVPGIHILASLKQEGRGWPGMASGGDALLRTAMPGHDEKENRRHEVGNVGWAKARLRRAHQYEPKAHAAGNGEDAEPLTISR